MFKKMSYTDEDQCQQVQGVVFDLYWDQGYVIMFVYLWVLFCLWIFYCSWVDVNVTMEW